MTPMVSYVTGLIRRLSTTVLDTITRQAVADYLAYFRAKRRGRLPRRSDATLYRDYQSALDFLFRDPLGISLSDYCQAHGIPLPDVRRMLKQSAKWPPKRVDLKKLFHEVKTRS